MTRKKWRLGKGLYMSKISFWTFNDLRITWYCRVRLLIVTRLCHREPILPGNSSDIKVVSGTYPGHFSFCNNGENKNIKPNDFRIKISWDSDFYFCYIRYVYKFLFWDRIYNSLIRESIGSTRYSLSLKATE